MLRRCLTASRRRQTLQELGQLIHEIRASKSAPEHQKNGRILLVNPKVPKIGPCTCTLRINTPGSSVEFHRNKKA